MAEPNIPSGRNENADIEKQMMQTNVKPGIHTLPGHQFWKYGNNFMLGTIISAIILSFVSAYILIFILAGHDIPLIKVILKSIWLYLGNKKPEFIALKVVQPEALKYVEFAITETVWFVFGFIFLFIAGSSLFVLKVVYPRLMNWHIKLEADYDKKKTKVAKEDNIVPTVVQTGLDKKEIDKKINIDDEDNLKDL
jgi:hypothetical protein